MVSIRDVAQRAEVSLGTVSKFLNTPQRVAPATQERIRSAIDALGYTRNEAARQLKTGRSTTLAAVALELNNPFFGAVAESMERRAHDLGLFLSVACTNNDENREAMYVEMLIQQRVHGVILASGLTSPKALESLRAARIPTVLLHAFPEMDDFSSCTIDDFFGGRQAAYHLIDEGRTRLAFAGGEERTRPVAQRLLGARDAVESAPGVTLEVLPTATRSVHDGIRLAEQILARDPADRPDAVLAVNDPVAIGLVKTLTSADPAMVPRDIAVVGYDDIDLAAAAAVPLSSVRSPHETLGRVAVDLIDERASPDRSTPTRHVSIRPELIVRASSRTGG